MNQDQDPGQPREDQESLKKKNNAERVNELETKEVRRAAADTSGSLKINSSVKK